MNADVELPEKEKLEALEEVLAENKDGLKRLAREEQAAEARDHDLLTQARCWVKRHLSNLFHVN